MLLTGAMLPAGIDVDVSGLRSDRGNLVLCVTRDAGYFPDCDNDPAKRRLTIPATQKMAHFSGLPAGDYAVSLIHDENGNGKLDTSLGIPREGIGFSRNPRVRFGPPSFAKVRFSVGDGVVEQPVKLQYFL